MKFYKESKISPGKNAKTSYMLMKIVDISSYYHIIMEYYPMYTNMDNLYYSNQNVQNEAYHFNGHLKPGNEAFDVSEKNTLSQSSSVEGGHNWLRLEDYGKIIDKMFIFLFGYL